MTIAQTPQAAQLSASQKLKQREDGIRANALKQGYAQRDAHWHKALGVQSVDEAREITQLRERPTLREYHRHGMARAFQGVAAGMVLGGIIMFTAYTLSLGTSFIQAAEYGSRMVVSGAALQSSNPPMRCIPGETLEDGRVCPRE